MLDRFRRVRAETERRAEPLSAEDQLLQSMPDASPIKWHRAHTTWFFEEFLLIPCAPGYSRYHEEFTQLFNSYYIAAGPRSDRPRRGLMSRPANEDVARYRAHVDAAVVRLVQGATMTEDAASVLDIGLQHEQQHQELMLTDILSAFALNPLRPAYDSAWTMPVVDEPSDAWIAFPETIATVGHSGTGFAYDNERPAHRVLVQPFRIRRDPVTNGEWLAFMADGGYRNPTLWLSDGWACAEREGWSSPAYWDCIDGAWWQMTLAGKQPLDPKAPVCHVSYYEADAFARWSGRHLPSEFEWEVAARSGRLRGAFDAVWQWTRSAYAPYPGYRAAAGALGEYNGKFMVNQMVLRGGSCATPAGHTRASYRNFFYPHARWQFSGVRLLADDA